MAKKTGTAELPELLDTAELARLLGSSPASIRNSHQRGRIPQGARVPGVRGLRWRRADIATWLNSQLGAGAQLRDPAWAYLGDAVARVRARCGELDTAAVIAAATWAVPEAARSLGVSENAVRAAIASGDLPSVVVAGRHMLDRRAVEAHVSTGTRAGKTDRVPALYARVGSVPGGANLVVAVLDADGYLIDGELLRSVDGVDELVWSAWAEAVILWGKGDKARAVRVRPAHGRTTAKIEFAGLVASGRWDVLDQTNNRKQAAELLGRVSGRGKAPKT